MMFLVENMFNSIFTVAEVLVGLFAAILAAYIYISKARTKKGKEERKRYVQRFIIYSISAVSILALILIILPEKTPESQKSDTLKTIRQDSMLSKLDSVKSPLTATQIPKPETTEPIYPRIKEIKKPSEQHNQKPTSDSASVQFIDSTSLSDHGRRGEKKRANYSSATQAAFKPDTTKPTYRVTINAPTDAMISIDDKVVGSGFVELQLPKGLHWISVQLDSLIWEYPKQINGDQLFNIQGSEMKAKK